MARDGAPGNGWQREASIWRKQGPYRMQVAAAMEASRTAREAPSCGECKGVAGTERCSVFRKLGRKRRDGLF